jgi:hypothetical protein
VKPPFVSDVSGIKMKYLIACIVLIFSTSLFAQSGEKMNPYQEQISNRRLAEAKQLWSTMKREGFTDTTVAALDFTFFSNDKNSVDSLVKALSENYSAEAIPAKEKGYWLIKGTTRPYGNEFNEDQWFSWVDFMVSLGFSNNAVFSSWAVYDPKSKKTWSSEAIEAE